MPASKRFVNWVTTTFTKTGPVVVSITTVQSIQIDMRGQTIKGRGDGDFYSSYSRTIQGDPLITVTHQNDALLNDLPLGTTGTFSTIHRDGVNDSGTGAITYTLAQAHIGNHQIGGSHVQIGSNTLMIEAYSTDGSTSPLSMAIAA